METTKLKVKELRDVVCPNCEGKGGWTECHGDFIWDGDCGLSEYIDCDRCNKTGKLEVEIEYCPTCKEEYDWNEDNTPFDEDTETFYLCAANECDRPKKIATSILEEKTEIPF